MTEEQKPFAYYSLAAACVTADGPQDFKPDLSLEAPADWWFEEGRIRNFTKLYAGSYVEELRSQNAETLEMLEYERARNNTLSARVGSMARELVDIKTKGDNVRTVTGDVVTEIKTERGRQISIHNYLYSNDDQYINGELAFAAAEYAFHAAAAPWDLNYGEAEYDSHPAPKNWPWDKKSWKPVNPRRDLVRAAALIIAEIERLDRAQANKLEGGE